MKFHLLAFSVLSILIISCAKEDQSENQDENEEIVSDQYQSNGYAILGANFVNIHDDLEPFQLELGVQKVDDELYALSVKLNPEEGFYFASPFSTDNFTGKLSVSFSENNAISKKGAMSEYPASSATYDYGKNTYINWVKNETTYIQHFSTAGNEDFVVGGTISFGMEPAGHRYSIPFAISSKSGVIKVRKGASPQGNNSWC